ncbi:MAG: PAS domain S-box protein [Desertifilum sp. SIO1I2]|nr:PAS domain S-box protein [Desertifilum sp. SIO1I2]
MANASSFFSNPLFSGLNLDASPDFLQQLIECCPVGLVLCRLDGTLIAVNSRLAQLLGRTVEELLSLTYWEITPETYRGAERSQFAGLPNLQHYGPYEKEYWHQAGYTIPVQVSRVVLQHAGESLIWSSVTDISDRKQAEQRLLKHYHLLQSIIDSTPDAIFVRDLQGIYVISNSANSRLFNRTSPEVVGRSDAEFMPLEVAQKLWEVDRRIVQTGISENIEEVLTVGDITYIFNSIKSVWRDAQGNPLGIVGISRDISDRKRAEQALRHYQETLEERVKQRTSDLTKANRKLVAEIVERQQIEKALRQSEAREREKATHLETALHDLQRTQAKLVQSEKMSSLGQLVAGIAHEINNPVNFIYGNITYTGQYVQDLFKLVELYQDCYAQSHPEIVAHIEAIDLEFVQEDLPRILESMRVGAERIREIVLSLRNFSRVDESQMKSVDIHEGLESTLLILQNRLKSKPNRPAINVVKTYSPLPKVECYPGQLNQVFMNVLCNAIDALEAKLESAEAVPANSSDSPTITISTEVRASDWVTISIADNGIGMSEQTLNQLFNLFFTTKPVGKGTGLGLPISYQIIVERHQGYLHCQSQIGQGTEFIIEIPLKQNHQKT